MNQAYAQLSYTCIPFNLIHWCYVKVTSTSASHSLANTIFSFNINQSIAGIIALKKANFMTKCTTKPTHTFTSSISRAK